MTYKPILLSLSLFLSLLAACGNSAVDTFDPEPDDAITELVNNENAEGEIEQTVTIKPLDTSALKSQPAFLKLGDFKVTLPSGKEVTALVASGSWSIEESTQVTLKVRKFSLGNGKRILAGVVLLADETAAPATIIITRGKDFLKLGDTDPEELVEQEVNAKLLFRGSGYAGIVTQGKTFLGVVAGPLKQASNTSYTGSAQVRYTQSPVETSKGSLLEITGTLRLTDLANPIELEAEGYYRYKLTN